MNTPAPTDIVSVYRCSSCGRLRLVEKGNHHPWCLRCMDDQFDWADGHQDITREEAEKLIDADD